MPAKFPSGAQIVLILATAGASSGAGGPCSLPGERAWPSAACAWSAARRRSWARAQALSPSCHRACRLCNSGDPLFHLGASLGASPQEGQLPGGSSQGFAAQQRARCCPSWVPWRLRAWLGAARFRGSPFVLGTPLDSAPQWESSPGAAAARLQQPQLLAAVPCGRGARAEAPCSRGSPLAFGGSPKI